MIKSRCSWVTEDSLYIAYHDEEWGRPQRDHKLLFETLMLEGFQAGLSWLTILKKRENFRAAFAGFDPEQLASWGSSEVESLLQDPGIIRHRGKIEATLHGARSWCEIMNGHPGGFSGFIWESLADAPRINRYSTLEEVPSETRESQDLSVKLKRAGFRFVGPKICYAFMQAAGLVNDHQTSCFLHPERSAR
ncbi:DNA-3-methyladenine glycosylase I [Fodinicurvata fenggangensis]|uniref:DNA-3-methyladenine glycosylase I n=1 Tax=Fodinicurvata fenggangensis TaxID=1121830 RepID=UPI00047DBCAE|nr:DNA-3-methyladenine glycosylase I [Fodinicurvata fenggangensis]